MMEMAFPALENRVDAKWAPLMLRPFLDSPERLVIGVAAVSRDEFYLAKANDLIRLECLLGHRAPEIIEVARLGLKSLEKQLGTFGPEIIDEFRSPATGISIGAFKEAVGPSLEEIGAFWLAATSSLHQSQGREVFVLDQPLRAAAVALRPPPPAAEVVRQVLNARPILATNFRPHFVRGKRLPAHQNDVDYKSDVLVANIDAIAPNFTAPTVTRIVKRMWDLEIDRGINDNVVEDSHEMLVEIPTNDELTRVNAERLAETVRQLTWQADQRMIRFRPMKSTNEISNRILEAEALAA